MSYRTPSLQCRVLIIIVVIVIAIISAIDIFVNVISTMFSRPPLPRFPLRSASDSVAPAHVFFACVDMSLSAFHLCAHVDRGVVVASTKWECGSVVKHRSFYG